MPAYAPRGRKNRSKSLEQISIAPGWLISIGSTRVSQAFATALEPERLPELHSEDKEHHVQRRAVQKWGAVDSNGWGTSQSHSQGAGPKMK